MIKNIVAIALLLLASKVWAEDAAGFGRGGTYLTKSSFLQSIVNSPVNLSSDQFIFEINISADASQSLWDLSKEDPTINPGTYNQRISPYYGSANLVNANAGAGIGYKGFTFFPKIVIANGEALINNPVYPEASASIKMSQGYGVGYGTQIGNYLLGLSYIDLNTKNQIQSGKILDYSSGLVNTISEEKNKIYNLGVGYSRQYIKLVSNYQRTTLGPYKDRFSVGTSCDLDIVGFYLDMQDIQSNNLENMSHMGMTFSLGYLKLSAGLNQLYPTYGIGFDSPYFKIFAAYGGRNQYEQFRKEYKDYSLSIIFSNF